MIFAQLYSHAIRKRDHEHETTMVATRMVIEEQGEERWPSEILTLRVPIPIPATQNMILWS